LCHQAHQLETICDVDAVPVVEVIRAAIAENVETRKQDSESQRSPKEHIERAQGMLRPQQRLPPACSRPGSD
jgi:hypothetical protein